MKKKFDLLIFTFTFFSMIFFTSCGRVVQKEEKKKVITLWETYNNEEHEVFIKIVEKFETLNPDIKIKVQRLPWGGHQTKLLVSMITHTAPDIARVDIALLPRLVKSRSVYDLTPFGALELAKSLVPAAVGSCIFPESFFIRGSTSMAPRIFGLPDQTTGVALFYNKKIFKRFNITQVPQTWEEFISIGEKLTRDIDNDGKPDVYGFGMWGGLWWSFPFFNTYGVEFIDDTGQKCLLYDSQEAKEVLKLMKRLYDEKIEGGAWLTGAINPDVGFMNDIYAMIFTGPWNVKRFKDAKIDFGITLIPKGPKGTSTNIGGTNMVVLKGTKYPYECYKFLEFLCSEEIQKFWCEQLGQIPVNLSAAKKIDFTQFPEIKIFTEQMFYAQPRPRVIDYDLLEEIVSTELYSYMTGTISVDEMLHNVTKQIEEKVVKLE